MSDPGEQHVVLEVHVLVHRRLEVLETMPQGPPRTARFGRHLVVAGQLTDPLQRRSRFLAVVLEIGKPIGRVAVCAAEDARKHVTLLVGHVTLELRPKGRDGRCEGGERGGSQLSVNGRHLARHRGEPRKFLAQWRVVRARRRAALLARGNTVLGLIVVIIAVRLARGG